MRKSCMHEYLENFNLSHVVPASLKGKPGWRPDWDAHVLIITSECIQTIETAAEKAWSADSAISSVAADIDFDI